MNKILLLRFSSLGDIVMATAMIRCVRKRFPDARIDMAVRADFLDLIRDNPHLDRKIGLPRGDGPRSLVRLLAALNRERYDVVYDAHRSLRSRVLMPWIEGGRKIRLGKRYVRRAAALTFKLPLLDTRRLLERYVDPLGPLGVAYDGGGPEVFVSQAARESMRAKMQLDESREWLGVVPSAQWPGKRWPLPYFRRMMERLLAETPHSLVVFGGGGDTFCTDLCRGLDPARVVNSQGRLSIAEAAAALERCRLVVANDTGLMHVADAVGVPSVLFLGPTSAEMGCLPFHPRSRVLEISLWCRPCSKNGQAPCIRGRRVCLEGIPPSAAVDAVREILAGARA